MSAFLHLSEYILHASIYIVKHRHTRDVLEPRHEISLMNMGQGWQEGEKDELSEPLVMPSQCGQL